MMRKALIIVLIILLATVVFAADWYPVTFKFSWDRSASGFCPTDSQCLIDPAGDKSKNNQPEIYSKEDPPECIADTQYIKDYYCDDGTWVTRTKLIALELLEFADTNSNNDFALFCGPYNEVLNNFEYKINDNPIQKYLEENRVNNFCILEYDSGIAFGTSLNLDIDDNSYSFLDALDMSKNDCSNAKNNNGDFDLCKDNIWYNHDIQSIIYLESGSLTAPDQNTFIQFIKNPFKIIIDYVYSTIHDTATVGKDFSVFNKTILYSNIYISKKSGKDVFAFLELGQSIPTQDYLGVKYANINLGQYPCDNLIKLYGSAEDKGRNAYCEQQTGSEFIVVAKKTQGEETPLIGAWKDLTAKLRIT